MSGVYLDLHEDLSSISGTIGKVDAIYFTAGSRGKDLLQKDDFTLKNICNLTFYNSDIIFYF